MMPYIRRSTLFWIISYLGLIHTATHTYAWESSVDPTLQLKVEAGYSHQGFPSSLIANETVYLYAPYLLAETSYELTHAWVVHAAYQNQFFSLQRSIQSVQGGIRYQLDILHYIPWFGIVWNYDIVRSNWNVYQNINQQNMTMQTMESSQDTASTQDNSMNMMNARTMIDESSLGDPLQWGIELGFDRRFSQEHVMSVTFRWFNLSGLSEAPSIFSLGVSWSFRWLLVDPFDD